MFQEKILKITRNEQIDDFYICSLSSRSIVYKGMFLAEALSDFYTDLNDQTIYLTICNFSSKDFSINTFPSWKLAQPFRCLAHNGEINTLKGNVNWMKIHEQDMSSNLFKNVEDLKPVITPGNSDSAALDNVFELLMHSGKPVPLIKLMMPDAWSKEVKFYLELTNNFLTF